VPRWPAAAALLAVGALYAAVSTELTPGPQLLVPVLVALLVAALMSAHVGGRRRLARRFALALVALVTVAAATSTLLLILVSLGGGTPAPALLGDAALIWAMNVVTFAVWYWEIDGGGPASRHGASLQRGLPLPPDGARRGGGARLVAGLRGLPLPRVQHQHGLQPHGHGDPQSAGEGAHDGPVGRLAGGRRRANRSRRQRARLHGIGHLRIAALPRRYHLQASFAEFDLGVILSSMVSRQISLL
jgi:hypothetical protein